MRSIITAIVVMCLVFSNLASPVPELSEYEASSIVTSYGTLPNGRDVEPDAVVMVVSIARQRLAVIRDGKVIKYYPVSTAKAGTGSKPDSDKTPLGWHRVSERIGDDAIPGQVFVSRRLVEGEVLNKNQWQSDGGRDYVLTRILWLDGLEPGKNKGRGCDSHSRYIYLHGTNQEHLLGQPASHGCIRLSNHDVMVVYAITEGRPSYVVIVQDF